MVLMIMGNGGDNRINDNGSSDDNSINDYSDDCDGDRSLGSPMVHSCTFGLGFLS